MKDLGLHLDTHSPLILEDVLIKQFDNLVVSTMNNLVKLYEIEVPYSVLDNGQDNFSFGDFDIKYKDGEIKSQSILIYSKPIIEHCIDMLNNGTESNQGQILTFLNETVTEVIAHEYGHALQVVKFERHYEKYLASTGHDLLNPSILMKHTSFESLILDKDFQDKCYELALSLFEMEKDANKFAADYLKEVGMFEASSKIDYEYSTKTDKFLFIEKYVIPRLSHSFQVICNIVFDRILKSKEVREFSLRMALVVCGLASEEILHMSKE